MIKTDQNADYYEGAMDCLDEFGGKIVSIYPTERWAYLTGLRARLKKLWEAYYDRFAADHGQPVEEVER